MIRLKWKETVIKLMNKLLGLLVFIIAAGLVAIAIVNRSGPETNVPANPPPAAPKPPGANIPLVSTVAAGLNIPWALAFLPTGNMLITERPGSLLLVDSSKDFKVSKIADLNEVKAVGEGGLLGVAVSPRFSVNKHIFLFYTYSTDGSNILNKLVRYDFDGTRLNGEKTILQDIPGSQFHNGGRIKFGPDGYLYVTTGDAQDPPLAQNKDSLAGKILRVDEEGDPPPDNPFGNPVYSYGHRNPEGLAWQGVNLYETEHGPTAHDEINTIIKGENYGWPDIMGNQKGPDMQSPLYQSGDVTWAPAGAAYLDNGLYFGGLRGNALYRFALQDGTVSLKEYFKGVYGRIRDVVLGPDKMLYITTSNRDGRGTPAPEDDRILQVNPGKLR